MADEMVPPATRRHTVVRLNNYILLFGGSSSLSEDAPYPTHVIWMYNVYTEQWRKYMMPSTRQTPPALARTCAVRMGADCYMFGGRRIHEFLKHRKLTNRLWKLSQTSSGCFVWNEIMPNSGKPLPRSSHTGWEYGGQLWIFGGYRGISPPVGYLRRYGEFETAVCNQLFCFNPTSNKWKNPNCFGSVPKPRAHHVTTVTGNKVWLYGGANSAAVSFDDLYELNLHTSSWSRIYKCQPHVRGGHPITPCEHSLLTISDNQLLLYVSDYWYNEIWILDIPSLKWTPKRKWKWTFDMRHSQQAHAACLGLNNSAIIFVGCPPKSTILTSHITLEPKPLQQLAMQTVYRNHSSLPLMCLPKKLLTLVGLPQTSDEI